jgi:hypothetical protein
MPEKKQISRELLAQTADGLAVPEHVAVLGHRQTTHQTQEARFTGAVGTGNVKPFAGIKGEIRAGKKHPVATGTTQVTN